MTGFPWDPKLPVVPVEDTVAAMQRDLAYMIRQTGVLVRSDRPELCMTINTARGQVIPQGVCTFADGTTVEFQDIGMPQVGAPQMTVKELTYAIWDKARELGLEML